MKHKIEDYVVIDEFWFLPCIDLLNENLWTAATQFNFIYIAPIIKNVKTAIQSSVPST